MNKLGRPAIPVIIGSVFGNWTVMERVANPNKNGSGGNYWQCRCICGRTSRINAYRLVKGKAYRCLSCQARSIHQIEDLSGRVFGGWTVVERIPPEKRLSADRSWLCRCQCGKEQELSVIQLKRQGECKSCAGKSRRLRPFEYLYRSIRARILYRYDRNKTQDFTISFEEFLSLIKTGKCHYCHTIIEWAPHGGTVKSKNCAHHMDRKDNNRGYVPGNVVAACTRCNFGKGARYTYEDWWGMTAYFRHRAGRSRNKAHSQSGCPWTKELFAESG